MGRSVLDAHVRVTWLPGWPLLLVLLGLLILSAELCRRSYSPRTYRQAPVVAFSMGPSFFRRVIFNVRRERLLLVIGKTLFVIWTSLSLELLKVSPLLMVSVIVVLWVVL